MAFDPYLWGYIVIRQKLPVFTAVPGDLSVIVLRRHPVDIAAANRSLRSALRRAVYGILFSPLTGRKRSTAAMNAEIGDGMRI